MARSRYLFSQKSSIVDVRLDSKYVSDINHQIPPFFHNSGILIYRLTMNVLCSHIRVEVVKSFISSISLLSTLQIY